MKKSLIVLGIIACITLGLYYIKWAFNKPCDAPLKPKGIPLEAIWSGDCDGGYWLELVSVENDRYRFRTYLDYKSKVVMDADYILDERFKNISIPKDKSILNVIKVGEPETIYLSIKGSSVWLKPVYPAYGGLDWETIKEK